MSFIPKSVSARPCRTGDIALALCKRLALQITALTMPLFVTPLFAAHGMITDYIGDTTGQTETCKPESFGTKAAIDDIRTDELRSHIVWLTAPEQEGRAAGTESAHRVCDYLVEQLNKYQLKLAGKDNTYVQGFRESNGKSRFRNVIGVIPGSDPELSKQYIMLCAHYDHLGVTQDEMYPGANDNASGTSMVLELAESFAKLEPKPKRSLVIAFWDAEEIGLVGSYHFATHPTIPLKQIIVAFNFDMVGTLQENNFEIFGANVAAGTREYIVRMLTDDDPNVTFSETYILASDHSSFYARKIPALMFFTGLNCPYHTPEDTIDIINFDGMKQIGDVAFRLVDRLANDDQLQFLKYVPPRALRDDRKKKESASAKIRATEKIGIDLGDHDSEIENDNTNFQFGKALGAMVTGVMTTNADDSDPLVITKIARNSHAEKLGLMRGDKVITLNGRDVKSLNDFDEKVLEALQSEPERTIKLRLQRPLAHSADEKEEITLDIAPASVPEIRGMIEAGFQYWESESEPNTLIVGSIIPNSAAEKSGLEPGDRIFYINGNRANRDTINEVRRDHKPHTFEIERAGRIKTLNISP